MNSEKAQGFRAHLEERIDALEDNLEGHPLAWLEMMKLARDLRQIVDETGEGGRYVMQRFAQLLELELELHGDSIIDPDAVVSDEEARHRQRFAMLNRIRVDWQKTSIEGDSDAQLLSDTIGADGIGHEHERRPTNRL